MVKDDIIRMALKCGAYIKTDCEGNKIYADGIDIERFAELVATAERDKYYELFEDIKVWREAYPVSIFPVPDWGKVRDALTMNGLTIDAVSAANFRHCINRFEKMLDETIRARENND